MLFNSFEFLGWFLPIVVVGFYALTWCQWVGAAKVFLILASLVFYGWFTPWFVLVLLASLLVTFLSATAMLHIEKTSYWHKLALLCGLVATLGNLMVWKYADSAIGGVNEVTGLALPLLSLTLPLGVSFYTFQLLTFVMDAYAGRVKGRISLVDFSVYVVFFPQLIVGPIVRYDELLPQISAKVFGRVRVQNLIVGFAILVVGLAKKVVLADNLALMVDPTFTRVGIGEAISAIEAWRGATAYTLQLYFDFSGYSDMAIGIARMFGLRLPVNFHSPLKGRSILDFWRRWHITLTRMTTSYVFTPISVAATRFAAQHGIRGLSGTLIMVTPACLITFLAIGFWHGASATFLLFGLVHTCYAVADYVWVKLKPAKALAHIPQRIQYFSARSVTLILIIVSLVLFRSSDVPFFFRYLSFLFGGSAGVGSLADIDRSWFNVLLFASAFAISQFAPNTQQMFVRYRPGLFSYPEHARDTLSALPRLTTGATACLGFLLIISLAYIAHGRSEFLYFGF